MKKQLIFLLCFVPIIVLLLTPRFGWKMHNGIDGKTSGNELSHIPFIGSDIVWNDVNGIFYWRYAITIVLSFMSVMLIEL